MQFHNILRYRKAQACALVPFGSDAFKFIKYFVKIFFSDTRPGIGDFKTNLLSCFLKLDVYTAAVGRIFYGVVQEVLTDLLQLEEFMLHCF